MEDTHTPFFYISCFAPHRARAFRHAVIIQKTLSKTQ